MDLGENDVFFSGGLFREFEKDFSGIILML